MEFDASFFENEIRDGFFVTSEMKHAWAAQLEVLSDVDKACRENGIQYFAEWGTLLGTVRHHGFIPWDDDMDICMKRPDYDRFIQQVKHIMPEEYEIFDIRSADDNDNMLARVINGGTINFEGVHLEKYHGFPYLSGLDIFPLDFIAPNEEDNNLQKDIIEIVSGTAVLLRAAEKSGLEMDEENRAQLEDNIEQIEQLCGVTIDRNRNLIQQLNILTDRLYGLYTEDEADYVTIMNLWTEYGTYKLPKEHYAKSVRMPFENTTIPVPIAYDAILKLKYGDYMKLVHTWDSHDYPFYDKQKKVLRERGAKFYEFRESGGTYESYTGFRSDLEVVRNARSLLKKNDIVAGKMGESCTDGGTDCVRDGTAGSCRKKVVFMPFKSECWRTLDKLFKSYSEDDNTDITVVPVPYYYKNYDGKLTEYRDEGKYPDYVKLVSADEYRFERENPDEIIFQYPYDGYDMSSAVDARFYTKNLALHTDRLTYVPYFVTDEIDAQDMRAYKSMDVYVTAPGVVYSDRVIVQSEGIKNLYVKKLGEMYGEDSKTEWENKILADSELFEKKEDTASKYLNMPEEWKEKARKTDGSYRKIIMYYVSTNAVLEHGMGMFEKIRRTMKIFAEYDDTVMPILVFEDNIEAVLEQMCTEALDEYRKVRGEFGEYADMPGLEKKAIDACDAFYGEAGAQAQQCRSMGKPIMIEDVAQ